VTKKRCGSDKSLKRSQLNFTAIIHARKATNPENFAKIGCVLSEIIASKQQKKPEAVSAVMAIQGR